MPRRRKARRKTPTFVSGVRPVDAAARAHDREAFLRLEAARHAEDVRAALGLKDPRRRRRR